MRPFGGWLWSTLFLASCTSFSGAEVSGTSGGTSGASAGSGGALAGSGGKSSGGSSAGGGTGGQAGASGQAGAGGSAGGLAGSGGQAGASGSGEQAGAGGQAGACSSPMTVCGETCTDLQSDPANCGKCGTTCASLPGFEAVCEQGTCGLACKQGQDLCGVACADLNKDPQNCGACGVACKADEVCSQGVCSQGCGDLLVQCGNSCVDPATDTQHCGACDSPCTAPSGGQAICDNGSCDFSCGNLSECGSACINTNSDPENCGGCGLACAEGAVCFDGNCVTDCVGLSNCNGTCTNLDTDPNNCGACGTVCPAVGGGVPVCNGGVCGVQCGNGLSVCGGACVNPLVDPQNCGACGLACGSGQCQAGSCVPLAVCGNGKVEPGEQCDGIAGDCSAAGAYKPGSAPCKSDCTVDATACIPLSCGNGQKDPGEECDGFISTNCAGFLKEGFGGSPTCLPNCKADLSACTYCGNGKRDPHEACEGSDLGGATCATLGAGSGTLSCKSCQFDLSQCSKPVCGQEPVLSADALWPADRACMARPGQSSLAGLASPGGPQIWTPQQTPVSVQSPPVVTSDGVSFFFQDSELWGWAGGNGTMGYSSISPAPVAPTLLQGNVLLRVSNGGINLLARQGQFSWNSLQSKSQGAGVLVTNVVVTPGPGPGYAFFARAGNPLRRMNLTTLSDSNILGMEARGSMAYDARRAVLYVPEDCSTSGANCRLRAIDTSGNNTDKIWELVIASNTTEACHVALGPGGTIYTACGASARFIHPDFPDQYSGGFNTSVGSIAFPPAIAKDGTVYLLFDGSNPVMMAASPQLKILWSMNTPLAPLSAPLLDSENNVYLCFADQLLSLDSSGNMRWSYPFGAPKISRCSLALSGPGQLDVITEYKIFRFNG